MGRGLGGVGSDLLCMVLPLTRDVWAGHGSTADGAGGGVGDTFPGGGDVNTGGEDVHARSVVGE